MGLFDWAKDPPKKKTPAKMDAQVKTYKQRMAEAMGDDPPPPPPKPPAKKKPSY